MKLLHCHNYYQQLGGEDVSYEHQLRLLRDAGHEVLEYTLHNDIVETLGKARTAGHSLWNMRAYREVKALIEREKPQLMHCTNTFPLLSPAVYYAARRSGIPVVQSLRNYRLLCPGWSFFRDGSVCEDCLGKRFAWPAVQHGCYRGSRAASAVSASVTGLHALAGTWQRTVSHYVTPSHFARDKFIQAGYPGERISVLHNFVDPDLGASIDAGRHAIIVGRLSPEKGIDTVLHAWRSHPGLPDLVVVGDGPLAARVQSAAHADPRIRWLGQQPHAEVRRLIGEAGVLLMPSEWYETFGRGIIEAYSTGTPVIASRLGSMAELVEDGVTGLLVTPGDSQDLRRAVMSLLENTALRTEMRAEARRAFETQYCARAALDGLITLYQRVLDTCSHT